MRKIRELQNAEPWNVLEYTWNIHMNAVNILVCSAWAAKPRFHLIRVSSILPPLCFLNKILHDINYCNIYGSKILMICQIVPVTVEITVFWVVIPLISFLMIFYDAVS